jgi:hypothetical protein
LDGHYRLFITHSGQPSQQTIIASHVHLSYSDLTAHLFDKPPVSTLLIVHLSLALSSTKVPSTGKLFRVLHLKCRVSCPVNLASLYTGNPHTLILHSPRAELGHSHASTERGGKIFWNAKKSFHLHAEHIGIENLFMGLAPVPPLLNRSSVHLLPHEVTKSWGLEREEEMHVGEKPGFGGRLKLKKFFPAHHSALSGFLMLPPPSFWDHVARTKLHSRCSYFFRKLR